MAVSKGVRAPKGGGSLTNRNGTWTLRRSVMVDGVQKRVYTTYPDQASARAAQNRFVPATAGDTITVAEWLTRWSDDLCAELVRNARESYAATIEGNINRYLIPLLGSHKLSALKPADVDRAWATMLQGDPPLSRPLSPKTVANAKSVLTRALRAAERDELVHRNVSTLSEPPKAHRGDDSGTAKAKAKAKTFTLDQTIKLNRWLFANLDKTVWALPTLVALELGARRGETLGLDWSDLDHHGSIRIERQFVRVSREGPKQYELRVLKTGAGKRTVGIRPALLEVLIAALKRTHRSQIGAAMFTDANGVRLNPDSLSNWFNDTCRQLGLPATGIHSVRHTHISIITEEGGVPIREAGTRAGHASNASTEKYRNTTRADDARSVAAWDRLMSLHG